MSGGAHPGDRGGGASGGGFDLDGLLRGVRDPKAARAIAARVHELAARLERPVTLMEVCGTHTHAIASAGLRALLPASVRLVSGPGCPVCVTPIGWVDRALALAARPEITIATFGDLMRVPSSRGTLEQARAAGADVRICYSTRDALAIAREEPGRQVVFLAVGFETTAPTIAAALEEAEADGLANFLILPGHKTIPEALEALVVSGELRIDGLICPGHVSVVIGSEAYRRLPEVRGVPCAVAGFAPNDVLAGVADLVGQIAAGTPTISNRYPRVVRPEGNPAARALLARWFEPADADWRGLGVIPGSGLALRAAFAHRDAGRIPVELPAAKEPAGCRCGEVLRGVIDPPDCPLFAAGCDPEHAIGACMVSSEGACAAWFRHERLAAKS